MELGTIPYGWISLASHARLDARFWLEVKQRVEERHIKEDDERAVEIVVKEVETDMKLRRDIDADPVL